MVSHNGWMSILVGNLHGNRSNSCSIKCEISLYKALSHGMSGCHEMASDIGLWYVSRSRDSVSIIESLGFPVRMLSWLVMRAIMSGNCDSIGQEARAVNCITSYIGQL